MAKQYLQLSKILHDLLHEHRMNPASLAHKVGLPVPTVHRIVTGKCTRPYHRTLEPIAEHFSISVQQLLGEEPLPSSQQSLAHKNNAVVEIPLLHWESLPFNKEIKPEKTITTTNNYSTNCFSVYMNDSSMEPLFSKKNILIFDPERKISDRNYVLVHLSQNNIYILRQIILDGNNKLIKPLNPDLQSSGMISLNDDDEIIAPLIEARQFYDEN